MRVVIKVGTAIERSLEGSFLAGIRSGIVRLKAGDVIRLFMRQNPLMRTSVSLSTIVIASQPRSSVNALGYIFALPGASAMSKKC